MTSIPGTEELSTVREKTIVRTSIIGIIANVFLVAFKSVVGLITNSIAVILDAVNNLSDALSSVITIIGTKLASRKPDKKHPLGHGRIEYLSAMIVAAIVLYAGITSLVESIKKIITPEKAEYTTASLIILAAAVVVKLVLGRYVRSVGKKVNSGSLIASGADAMFDAVISLSVLVSAVIYMIWGISLEAYVGALISLFIIKSGISMLLETLNEILGKRVDREYLGEIKKTILEDECVSGVYDLILHSYGPETYVGSVHVEIPDTMSADEIDLMERRIAENVMRQHGVILAGIGIYSKNTKDDFVKEMQSTVTRVVMEHDGVLQIHGFYVDTEKKSVSFDIIIDYAIKDREKIYDHIVGELREKYPEYTFFVVMDIDV